MTKRAESIVTTIAALPLDSSLWDDGDRSVWMAAHASASALAGQVERRELRATEAKARDPRPASRLPRESAKTKRERVLREQVRTERLRLNPECEGPARGLPGPCGIVDTDRPPLEVNELVERSLAPGAHLVLGLTCTLCQRHHDYATDATGDALVIVQAAGLALPSNAVHYVVDSVTHKRGPRLRPEWSWARPEPGREFTGRVS